MYVYFPKYWKSETREVTHALNTNTWKFKKKNVYESYSKKHYENMPIQIQCKFHLQKLKIFR